MGIPKNVRKYYLARKNVGIKLKDHRIKNVWLFHFLRYGSLPKNAILSDELVVLCDKYNKVRVLYEEKMWEYYEENIKNRLLCEERF